MASSTPGLNPSEVQYYKTQANRLTRQYGYGSAQNRYERSNAAIQNQWGLSDINKQYGRARETISDPYNQRGMMNSGLWQQALTRFNVDRTSALQRQQLSSQQKTQGYD